MFPLRPWGFTQPRAHSLSLLCTLIPISYLSSTAGGSEHLNGCLVTRKFIWNMLTAATTEMYALNSHTCQQAFCSVRFYTQVQDYRVSPLLADLCWVNRHV